MLLITSFQVITLMQQGYLPNHLNFHICIICYFEFQFPLNSPLVVFALIYVCMCFVSCIFFVTRGSVFYMTYKIICEFYDFWILRPWISLSLRTPLGIPPVDTCRQAGLEEQSRVGAGENPSLTLSHSDLTDPQQQYISHSCQNCQLRSQSH